MLQFVLQLCCSCVAVQVHATQQDTFHWHESFWQLCPTKVATVVLGSHHPHLAKKHGIHELNDPNSRPLKPWPKLRRRNVTSTVWHLDQTERRRPTVFKKFCVNINWIYGVLVPKRPSCGSEIMLWDEDEIVSSWRSLEYTSISLVPRSTPAIDPCNKIILARIQEPYLVPSPFIFDLSSCQYNTQSPIWNVLVDILTDQLSHA